MKDATPKLVIIDDDPKLAGVVATIARETYPDPRELVIESIITAEAAVLAIRRWSHEREAAIVVISDFHLPPSDIDGIQILQEVRRRVPAAKRVLMTGRDPEELAALLEEAQLDAFVSKPFTFEEMRALIERLVTEVAIDARSTKEVPVSSAAPAAPTGGRERSR
jgi:DNA-binding NtrC family response regulator